MARAGVSTTPLSRLHSLPRQPALLHHPHSHVVLRAQRKQPFHLAYQPPASSTFLSEQTSHQQPASSTFLSE
jgi:magnesium-protoporphyrin O-methyltransferase